MISNLEKKLVKYLSNKNGWVSSREIISYLDISLRSLRTLVKNINTDAKEQIVLYSNRGYRLAVPQKKISSTFLLDKSNTNRPNIILKRLLTNKKEVDMYELADELCVSEQTIISDINKIRRHIAHYDISIIKNGDLFTIKGNEDDIRRLISDEAYRETQNETMSINALGYYFKDIDISSLKKTVLDEIKKSGFIIDNDYKLLEFILHLCIFINRKDPIGKPIDMTEFDLDNYLLCSKCILDRLGFEYDIIFNNDDLENINALLKITVNADDFNKKDIDKDIRKLVSRIISSVYNEFLVDLNNPDFISTFSLHLESLINNKARVVRNPLLYEIKNVYPVIYEIAVYVVRMIKNRYPEVKINDDEISYIALHIGAQVENQTANKFKVLIVNPKYLNLNSIIRNKIESNFSNELIIVDIVSNVDEAHVSVLEQSIDFIISTFEIKEKIDVPYVRVSIFINHDDILEIINVIKSLKKERTLYKESLTQYFDGTFCYFDKDFYTRDDIIQELCSKHPELDESFYKRILLREEMSPTEYLNMAIVHPFESNEKHTFITAGIFKKPFRWNINKIDIVLLLSVSKDQKEIFIKIFSDLVEVFTSDQWCKAVGRIDTYEKFIEFLKIQET